MTNSSVAIELCLGLMPGPIKTTSFGTFDHISHDCVKFHIHFTLVYLKKKSSLVSYESGTLLINYHDGIIS